MIDPGIGFGKRKEQNAEILARLPELARLELPILVGPSRKSFLAQQSEEETRYASAAAIAAAILNGAHMVRVHDIPEMKAAVQVADAVSRIMFREPAPPPEAPPPPPRPLPVRPREVPGGNRGPVFPRRRFQP